ncbi:MAG: carboxypeptidase regulatory-like domain-containing protein [Thermoplasmata archaeon]|nr:MAG: carboxypeptidase regulatory-like domain-containing protein [Thermoplasmata archaeon]
MLYRKTLIITIVFLTLLGSPVYTFFAVSQNEEIVPCWNNQWRYRQEIVLPISTDKGYAKYQPIDIDVEFNNPCWAENNEKHSIRVCCWSKGKWYELESQIYDLEYTDPVHIKKCGLVFLVPEFADGKERYFIYYDKDEKNPPNYVDHVNVEDSYYYYEPIPGVLAEGDYYKIVEDGDIVFGVGQKGKAIYRMLSQCIVKQKPGTKEFGITSSDDIVSFCFSYQHGTKDKDEISSDQVLVSKEICVDGNLMVEFRIISESQKKDLRTTNVYKYYYSPTEDKRISVHVKHQVFEKGTVEGIENVDGRYGALLTYKSTSEKIQKMCFGEILPYLHVYGEDDRIKEYRLDPDPEGKEREWIIPYTADCDLGKDAWISYDEGEQGKTHAVIFSSNHGIVKEGTKERDGIQVKVAEKEYMDVMGTEIDYAAINFGRNSYEPGSSHDLEIPNDLVVEFNAEFFTSEKGGYPSVVKESKFFQELIKHRHNSYNASYKGNQNIYTLTVKPRLTGRFFIHPLLANLTRINITNVYAELYRNNEYISTGIIYKPVIGAPRIKFPKIAPGEYIVKIYLKIGKQPSRYIGCKPVKIEDDTQVDVYCTWPKNIIVTAKDQHGENIENMELLLCMNNTIVETNVTTGNETIPFTIPFSLFDTYVLKAFYKGFKVYEEKIPLLKKNININLELYDLTINVKDKIGFPPGVNVKPTLISPEMIQQNKILSKKLTSGKFLFEKLPRASYILYLSYGGFSNEKSIKIPEDCIIDVDFTAMFNLRTSLLDSHGNPVNIENQKIDVLRDGETVFRSIPVDEVLSLPPGEYTIHVFSDEKIIGIKNFDLTNDKNIKIVTTQEPLLAITVTMLTLLFIGEIIVLKMFKKISLNTFLKLLAMSLILLSLFQPWWVLNAHSSNPIAEKNTEMFITPQTMIEKTWYQGTLYLDIATIPEIFSNFLGVLLLIVLSGFFLLGVSFLPNIILKRRFYMILISASVLFLIMVATAYFFGMSRITEISLGSLQGQGTLNVVLPDKETTYMSGTWGLGFGFYLCVLAALTALSAGVIDFISRIKKHSEKTS